MEQGGREEGQSEIDAGGHGNLAQEVEPAGEPAPGRRVVTAELGGPVVETACSRVARANLGHGEADDRDEDAYQGPTDCHDDRAAGIHAVLVEGQTARQDRDDGE